MLWPEGSPAVVADIGSYLDPPLPNEHVRAFSVSKASSYLAVASQHVIALFRLKPFTPLAVYPELFQDTEIVDIIASPRGENIAVLTADSRVSVFSVQPRHDIEEVLRVTCIVTPGSGEAIGARELWLSPIGSVYTEHNAVSLGALGPLLIVYCEHEIQIATWHSFETKDPLKPPSLQSYPISSLASNDKLVSALSYPDSSGQNTFLSCVITAQGQLILVDWKQESSEIGGGAPKPYEYTTRCRQFRHIDGKVRAVDFNVRMSKLAVVSETGKISIFRNVLDSECKPFEFPFDGARIPLCAQWTHAGTALLVGYADGWKLVSMLGLDLYNHRERALESGDSLGVQKAEWLVSAEIVLMLGSDGQLRLQNMLRWSGLAGSERNRPVLFGNGRLMLFHDTSVRGIASGDGPNSQSWLTIPLPTWYMAQNWPIAHMCSSPDGRFVAVAGSIGIMLFSVATRQWKEIGDRESMVRGGLCWFGRRLVAATVGADDGTTSLKMFSSVGGGGSHSKQSSQSGFFGSQFLAAKPNSRDGNSQRGLERRLSAQDLLNEEQPSFEGLGISSTVTADPRGASGTAGSTGAAGENNGSGGSGSGGAHLYPPPALNSPSTATSPSSPLMTASPSTSSIAGLGASSQEQQVVAKDVLGKGNGSLVSLMVKGPKGLLGVLAGRDAQRLLIYDLSQVEFDLVRDMPLAGVLAGMTPQPAIRAITLISESQVLVLVGSTLMLISSIDEDSKKYQRQVVADPIESFEYLATENQLWVFDGQEAVVTKWSPTQSEVPAKLQNKYVASIPLDAYPVHYSSTFGVISLVEAESVRSFDGSYSVARPVTTHEVYVPYVLESALVPAYEDALKIARKHQKVPYFAGILETLLYRAVANDEEAGEIKLAIKLIREFPDQNFEAIVAGCARKVEMKYWERLFEAVGKSASDLFDDCLERGDLETANEFLIVVQTSGQEDTSAPQKLETDGQILKLYKAAAASQQLWICKQLCEFIIAVDPTGSLLRQFRTSI